MGFLFVIGLLLLGLAGALIARALALSRVRAAAQLREIETYGFHAGEGNLRPAEAGTLRAQLVAFAERVGAATKGSGWRAPVEARSLRAAGLYSLSADAFHGLRVIASVGMPAFILLMSLSSGSLKALNVLLVIVAAALCWFGSAQLVRARAQRRMDEIDRALPELIDVLTATIEAGLGFAGSLQLVADRFAGPLGQELRLTLQEQSMGLSSDRALANLLDRCDTPSVRAFVRAVQQGESLGVSIATMMRNLATETRKRRRQNAHAQIQRAPVKMLLPLVFLIFPALLIVLLYPAITQLTEQLGGH